MTIKNKYLNYMIIRKIKSLIIYVLLLALFSISLQAQKVDLKSELISRYEFNGNADDMSGNGNHGVLHGPVSHQDRFGNPNSAFFFDGIDDYIEVSPVSDVASIGDFTIAVWANCFGWEIQTGIVNGIWDSQYIFDGHSYSRTVASNYLREGFHVNCKLKDDNSEYVTNTTSDFDTQPFINDLNISANIINIWHHIVFSRNGSFTNHYVDGILIDIRANNTSLLNMQHNWFIGTFSGNNPNYNGLNYNFYGLIDDIYIFDRAINACEVEALYSGNFPPER